MSDFERLKMLLEHIGISANRLSKEIGLSSPQVFYDIKAGRCGISKDLARKIQDKYLNIDMAWLLTGTGSMIKDEKAVAVPIVLYLPALLCYDISSHNLNVKKG